MSGRTGRLRLLALGGAALLGGALCWPGHSASTPDAGHTVDVSVAVHYEHAASLHRSMRELGQRTVVWLEPIGQPPRAQSPGAFTMTQKDKQFHPRLLVVPVGSSVAFPNADPFFHNVFSLFNGRRFDLGLYQSGQSRSVTFSREGVSYIFCNIHPEMSAVIVSLGSPYYGMPGAEGRVAFHGVPEGEYTLEVWSELTSPESLRGLSRTVRVDRDGEDLGTIEIQASAVGGADHMNKFGLPYDRHAAEPRY